jgi:hypothetical protein
MSMRDLRSSRLARLVLLAALAGITGACSDCDLTVSTPSLPEGVVGIRYAAQLNSDCGGDDWFIQTGGLPPGVGLQEDGDMGGIPTTAGVYDFTVGVFDFGSGEVAYKGFEIEITDAES